MSNLNEHEKNCTTCGKVFSTRYLPKDGYAVTLKTSHCSRSCASKSPDKKNQGCIAKDVGGEILKNKVTDFIREKNEYCAMEEICTGIGHSSKMFTKHGLKVSELNRDLGFVKPKSKFQEKVGEFLQQEFSHIETEKKFDGLVGTTGYPLRVDFYIPEKNLVIEADGSQHKNPKHIWQQWNNGTVQEYDKIKEEFFKEKGITLERIPYKRNLKKSDVLSRLS